MNNFTFVTAAALALALAAGSAQAGGKLGGASGMDRAGDGRNGVQLNGIPVSGSAIETVELPDGSVLAGGRGGVGPG